MSVHSLPPPALSGSGWNTVRYSAGIISGRGAAVSTPVTREYSKSFFLIDKENAMIAFWTNTNIEEINFKEILENMKEYVEKIREKALSENRTEYENVLEKYRKYLLKLLLILA